ncbi:uncharacterized protein LOC123266019 [Cotesia glomerata]|uniref:uncharacterized protein LOC123266019 n=1 Tax=Cotesia glomerata TaxID=32391 RepID=UPI001D01ADF8|nr:uncharacterized protein LOC123266019 [Cotesia glomerata]
MANLTTLKRQRGHIQATMTTLKKHLDSIPQDRAKTNLHLIKSALDTVIKAFQKFESIQDEIEGLVDEEIENRNNYTEMYDRETARAKKLLEDLRPPAAQEVNTVVPTAAPGTMQTIAQSTIKLPPINLKPFDGSPEKWSEFFSLFTSVMKDQPVEPVQKLNYLKSSLTGKAARAIESLELINSNFDVAISILKEKYEHPRRMTRRHMTILREFPKLVKDSPTAINELVDVFHQHTRALENLGAPVEFWDIPLVDLILSKVNSTTAWQWELTLNDDKCPPFKELLRFLSHRANCAEPSHNDSNHNKQVKNEPRTQALFTHSKGQGQPSHQRKMCTCPVCGLFHLLYTCDQFREASVDERRKIVYDAHLCFNCFGKGHGVNACTSQGSCKICRKRHHTLLHIPEEQKRSEQQQTSSNIPAQHTSTYTNPQTEK